LQAVHLREDDHFAAFRGLRRTKVARQFVRTACGAGSATYDGAVDGMRVRSAENPEGVDDVDLRQEGLAAVGYTDVATKRVAAATGIEYAYRDLGDGDVPLVLLQHFRGNLDNWDRALVEALASDRRVIAFDNTGAGGSSGTTPRTRVRDGARAIAFSKARGLEQIDVPPPAKR
jgi:hypothetical protein